MQYIIIYVVAIWQQFWYNLKCVAKTKKREKKRTNTLNAENMPLSHTHTKLISLGVLLAKYFFGGSTGKSYTVSLSCTMPVGAERYDAQLTLAHRMEYIVSRERKHLSHIVRQRRPKLKCRNIEKKVVRRE